MLFFALIFGMLLTWCFDISCYTLSAYPYAHLTLCLYFIMLYHNYTLVTVFLGGLLLSLQSFLYYDRFGLNLLYIVPITLLVAATKHAVSLRHVMPYLLLTISCLVQIFLIEYYILSLPITFISWLASMIINSAFITTLVLTQKRW